MSRSSMFLVAALTALAGGSFACTPPQDAPPERGPAPPAGTDRLKPTYDATGKLQKLQYDRDSDGRIDTWGYMDGTRVVKVEVDENGDGMVDRWEYHRDGADGAASPSGTSVSATSTALPGTSSGPGGVDTTIERIDRATQFDGRVSRREFFAGGVLTRTEEDTDGDGKIDKWETYVDGSLSVMALDTRGRGTPDRRLVYRPDGSLDRIEADQDGSGTFVAITP